MNASSESRNFVSPLSIVNRPDVLVVSVRPILESWTPQRNAYLARLYRETPPLRKFMEHFTFQRLIESVLIRHYDQPEAEHLVWEVIESLYPSGTGAFGDSLPSLENFDQIRYFVTEELDDLLRERLKRYELTEPHTSYLFHQWLDPTTMILTHYGYDSGI